jgi:hypothetical protein
MGSYCFSLCLSSALKIAHREQKVEWKALPFGLIQDGFAAPWKGLRCLMAVESFAVKEIHPANGFGFTDLTEISQGGLQVLMP